MSPIIAALALIALIWCAFSLSALQRNGWRINSNAERIAHNRRMIVEGAARLSAIRSV